MYYQTKFIQAMKTEYYIHQYQMGNGAIISKDRIMSLLLYTDYTALSSDFTSTFRKSNPFEPIQATIQRHRSYYWWGKFLRETVDVYGLVHRTGLSGPFYCGMSTIMTMPQFAIKLFSPTSTSCKIAVATKFSAGSGIIIEFDNGGGTSRQLRGFDASCFSRFREEDERYARVFEIINHTLYVNFTSGNI